MNTNPNATRYTAIGLVVFGLIFIFFAWNGASSTAAGGRIGFQFPYLLSGGLGGIALVMAGLTLVRTFEARRDALRLQEQLARLTAAVERLEAATRGEEVGVHALESHVLSTSAAAGAGAFPPPTSPPFEPAP